MGLHKINKSIIRKVFKPSKKASAQVVVMDSVNNASKASSVKKNKSIVTNKKEEGTIVSNEMVKESSEETK